jgi:Ca-activated chloride channel family protein
MVRTEGIREQAQFESLVREAADANIAVTSIGMGVTYNETLMMAISKAGGGNYHFIKTAGDVSGVVAAELDDLSRSVARGIKLRVELAPDVELVRVLGSDQLSKAQAAEAKAQERKIDQKVYEELGIVKDRKQQDEPGIKMLIPSLGANDSHVVLMELRVPRGRGAKNLAKVHVKYKDMVIRTNKDLTLPARANYAPDKVSSVASINRSVKKNILGFQTGEALMDASRLVSTQRLPEAVRRIDDQMVLLGVAAREWRDADLERDAKLLGQYKDVLSRLTRQGYSQEVASYLGKSFSYSAYQRLQ